MDDNNAIIARASGLLEYARGLHLDSKEEADIAVGDIKRIKAIAKAIDDRKKTLTAPARQIVAAANELFKTALDNLKEAEQHIKSAIADYNNRAAAIQAQMQAEADAKAEALRLQMQVDAQKAIEDNPDDDNAAAMALMAAAQVMTAPVVEEQKAAGAKMRKLYRAEVTNPMALIQAIAEGTVPLDAVTVNEAFLNKEATRLKKPDGEPIFPGVISTVKTSVAV